MSNWGSRQKQVAVCLVLLVVMLSGCTAANKSEMTSYVMTNGLVVESPKEGQYTSALGCTATIYSPQISGLKDTALEEEINARIRQMTEELADAPPPAYRGLKVRLSKSWAISTIFYQ